MTLALEGIESGLASEGNSTDDVAALHALRAVATYSAETATVSLTSSRA